MRIQIRSDLLIFGLSDPDPLLFLPDPTCNNVYIISFSSWTKYKPGSINSSYDDWLTKYFHSRIFLNKPETSYWWTAVIFSSFRIKVGSGAFYSWAGSRGKNSDPHPWFHPSNLTFSFWNLLLINWLTMKGNRRIDFHHTIKAQNFANLTYNKKKYITIFLVHLHNKLINSNNTLEHFLKYEKKFTLW